MESKADNGSNSNLNESQVALLSDLENKDEKLGKLEKIELDSKDEGKESNKAENGPDNEIKTDEKSDDGEKKEKSGKKKKKALKDQPKTSRFTIGLNLLDRDEKQINDQIKIGFDDVIAEPEGSHSFDNVFKLSHLVFSGTKFWIYRILAALCAIPWAISWAFLFAIISLINIWILVPLLKLISIILSFVAKILSLCIHTVLDPFFESCGKCLGNIRTISRQDHQV